MRSFIFNVVCLLLLTNRSYQENHTISRDLGQISAEKRLIKRLMSHYEWMGRDGRPVRNSSMAVKVVFGLGLKQMDLNEKQKMLTLGVWTKHDWTDEYLVWDPDEYEGILQLTVDPTQIWTPDIMLFNPADIDVPSRTTLAIVSNTGHVSWFPHRVYHGACSVDIRNFPFDHQKCNLGFGSWTHPSKELDIHMAFPGGLDLSTYESDNRESNVWELLNVTAKRQLLPSEERDPNFAVLTFELHMSRKLVFSSYILTLPCIFLAFLTLVVFWVPPDGFDRTALAMSTFSTFMILLLILIDSSPSTANTIPILGVYYCINMVIIVMTIVLSTVVINLSRGPKDGKSRPPAWLSTVTLKYIARVFCMSSIHRKFCSISYKRSRDNQPTNDQGDHLETHFLPSRSEVNHVSNAENSDACVSCSSNLASLRREMEGIRRSIQLMEETVRMRGSPDASYEDVFWEWRAIAMVVDRFFFWLYIVVIGTSLFVFFPRPGESVIPD